MVGPGVNLAITKDGGTYNKLQRPPDYLTARSVPSPPNIVSSADTGNSIPLHKRKRELASTAFKSKRTKRDQDLVQTDACGMRAMLPGLDDEDLSSDDSTGHAIAYLRSVRSEASAIPNLLGSATVITNDRTDSDEHTLFREGAWIAVDSDTDQTSGGGTIGVRPQERYHQLLLKRFHSLRRMLASANEDKDTAVLESATNTHKPYQLKNEWAWSDAIERDHPHLGRISRTDDATIYRGLQYCTKVIAQASTITEQHSCWIWSLLAAVGDVGTLDNAKISHVRELGQQGGSMAARLQRATCQALDHERDAKSESDAAMSMSGDEDASLNGAQISPLERARAHLLTQLGDRLVHDAPTVSPTDDVPTCDSHRDESNSANSCLDGHRLDTTSIAGNDLADTNTKITVEMILTIVAEYFGQRDLLRYREPWQ
ncbi:hypothetical protein EK21DRAFT_56417 [Setomelanomma holmii]|uniref:Uncharacterized protein n=1 Tax=Setomelanomma holmii TaxID=210430 RepID=A0A9P4HH87_9PLEO|nr:hypothetical protein EK21DRAFT_56417 [Setomelanomma holmii]